jgi:hypothetical protein
VLRPAMQQQHRLASARLGKVNPDPASRAGHIHQTVMHRWRRGKSLRQAGRGDGSHADKLAPPHRPVNNRDRAAAAGLGGRTAVGHAD